MKELLTRAAKLGLEQSRNRERVICLNKKSDSEAGVTDEERAELSASVDRLESIEPEIRAAVAAEAAERAELEAEAAKAGDDGLDPETRERNDLAKRATVGNFLIAAITGRRIEGAEAEIRAALSMGDSDIPMAVMDVPHRERLAAERAESRAVTPAGGTVGVNMAMIQPFVFAPSIASRLGIEIRNVGTGTYSVPRISTVPSTAEPKNKGGVADATAGALTVMQATPKRVPAQLSLALEDIASVGMSDFESALREALQARLSDSLDGQIITGSGAAPNLNGLINQLDNPAAPAAAVETFDRWAAIAASVVDGLWASRLGEVATVWNAESYRQASGVFRGADGPISAASYLMRETAAFFCNARMPATSANIATGIAARLGQPGLSRAIVPSWGRISIDDIFSDASKGQRHVVLSAIVGDLILVQPDAYEQVAARVSAP